MYIYIYKTQTKRVVPFGLRCPGIISKLSHKAAHTVSILHTLYSMAPHYNTSVYRWFIFGAMK